MSIDLDALVRPIRATPLIVEGAGGVLVPVNDSQTMADLMVMLGLPVIVAARSTLGTINHTLLTIEALRARALRVAGVVMIGDGHADNRAAIEHYGNVPVVAEMPRFDPLTPESLRTWAEMLPKDLIA
jgi:dethiobiotin synthetase